MTLDVELNEQSIDEAISKIESYGKSLRSKTSLLVEAMTKRTEEYAAYELSQHIWSGDTLASLRSVHKADSYTSRVVVGGAAVWLEFGTGVVANNCVTGEFVHPKAQELGMFGIGEYGHGLGSNPNGWWFYDENGRKIHTYGIPATRFLYHSAWNTRRDVRDLAKEVFATI